MDDQSVGELEAAISDLGLLLVRLEKYRSSAGPEALALRRRALGLGDQARRLHHNAGLDSPAARALLGEVRDLVGVLHASLAAIRDAPGYRAAVAAHAAGDATALAGLLPEIFDGLEPFMATRDLFYSVPWRRRGRPRRPDDLAAEVAHLRTEGILPDGDDLAPGIDPALPAVALEAEPPNDEVVVLRIPVAAVPPSAFRLVDGGEVLVYCARLHAPITVRLRAELDADAVEEAGGLDYAPYRAAVAAALAAVGIPVDD